MDQCNLCGKSEIKVLVPKSPSGRIVRCANCGLVYASPRQEAQLIRGVGDLGASETEVSGRYYLEELKMRERNAKQRLELLQKFIKEGKLLEIGSYIGIFLKAAQERGFDAQGIEPIAVAAEYGRKHYNLDISTATIEEADFSPGSFAAVALYETIEHLADPKAALQKINGFLRPGGILAIETPNIDNFWFKILRGHWRQFIPSHFYFFSPRTIGLLLDKTGFEILDIRTMGKFVSLSLLAKEIGDNYSRVLGQALAAVIGFCGLGEKIIRLNLGDVMIIQAKKK